jgi:hypothetical protein
MDKLMPRVDLYKGCWAWLLFPVYVLRERLTPSLVRGAAAEP